MIEKSFMKLIPFGHSILEEKQKHTIFFYDQSSGLLSVCKDFIHFYHKNTSTGARTDTLVVSFAIPSDFNRVELSSND